jgi:hypothetical protein
MIIEENESSNEQIESKIDKFLEAYVCKHHQSKSFDNQHGCIDCYNTGLVLDSLESQLLYEALKEMRLLRHHLRVARMSGNDLAIAYTNAVKVGINYQNELRAILNNKVDDRAERAIDCISHHICCVGSNNTGSLKRAIRILKGEE